MNEPGAFLIAGCQRSGTTLMRLVLECHPEVECRDEARSYSVMAGSHRPIRKRPRLGLKIPCLTEQLLEPTLWDPILLPATTNRYDGEPILFLVRDVRDVVASMRALRIFGRPWLDAYLEPTLRAKLAQEVRFAARYGAELSKAAESFHSGSVRAALSWRYKNDAVARYVAASLPLLVVQYEDLVSDPRRELERVCTFLRLPWNDALLAHNRQRHGELDAQGLAIGGTDPRRAIDRHSVGGHGLTASEVNDVLCAAGDYQRELYAHSA